MLLVGRPAGHAARMLRRFGLLVVVLFAVTLRAALPFPQEHSDLRPDPAVRWGTLPNGLRYAVMANPEPKARASLRLLVLAGSLNEADDQRGLAHFLEHMAFNGSTHYAPNTLVEFFQRMGMSFGGDTNASTSFDQTLYQLELPDTRAATLHEGLQVFADYAGGLLLTPAMIEKERGIILSEKRTRDDVGYRTVLATSEFLLAGTRLPLRQPIGLTDVIEHAPRERFVEFWNTWYRPELMAVIAVGDFDPAAVEKQIAAAFSGLKPRAPAAPPPDLGRVAPAAKAVRAFYHAEPEAPATTVSLSVVTPFAGEPDNAANRLKYLPRLLAHAMLNRRLAILAKKEDAPFVGASADAGESFDLYREASLNVSCKAGQWPAALAVGEQELRRALTHGFQPAELREVTANVLNGLEQAVKTAPTRHSDELAFTLAQSLVDRQVFTTPADDLALYRPALARVTVADCLDALRATWAGVPPAVLVTGNAAIPGDAAAAIVAAYEKSRATPVAAPEALSDLSWGYTDFGAPGRVVQRTQVADLGITLVTFANGVRLNLKQTDFEAGVISLGVRVGSGQLTEPPAQPGLAAFASATFTAGGLGRHSADDLRRILAGRTVGVGFNVGGDALQLAGATNREDLLLELQLVAAHLTDPGYRPEALRQVRKRIEQLYLSFDHTTSGPLTLEVERRLANGDPRFGLPARDVLLARNFDETRAWLAPQLAHGAMEVAIVGDLDVDATIDAVARTLGALPARAPREPLVDLRKVSYPKKPFNLNYTVETEIPKGLVALFWPTTDARDVSRTRRLNLLASVLNDRLRVKVREEIGGAYDPGADSAPSDIYPGYGFMTASITVDPARAQPIADAAVALAADLSAHGVTEDELTRAREPMLTAVRESLRDNAYWLTVLARAQEQPERLDWARTREADIKAVTTADLAALAKAYLDAGHVFRVTVLPAPAK